MCNAKFKEIEEMKDVGRRFPPLGMLPVDACCRSPDAIRTPIKPRRDNFEKCTLVALTAVVFPSSNKDYLIIRMDELQGKLGHLRSPGATGASSFVRGF